MIKRVIDVYAITLGAWHKHKKGWLVLLPLFFVATSVSFGQFKTVPLGDYYPLQRIPNKGAKTADASLQLPFFDDFANSKNGIPNPNLWITPTNIWVNNTYSTQQPSVNMASFDGLKANGSPYIFPKESNDSLTMQGRTDSLMSKAIDLSSYSLRDSLYLSFYYQNTGLGEQPDPNDSLQVLFLNSRGQWNAIWTMKGKSPNPTFMQQFIGVKSADYLHEKFQFKFVAFGRLTGQFDTWNVDYVYFNKARTLKDNVLVDAALRKEVSPLLKRYRSMPIKQLLQNPSAVLVDSISTDLITYASRFNPKVQFKLTDQTGATLLTRDVTLNDFENKIETRTIRLALPKVTIASASKVQLKATFEYASLDGVNIKLPNVLTANDTISKTTVLEDYYAYDDGTAEASSYLSQGYGKVAVQFINNGKVDSVRAIRLAIAPSLQNLVGKNTIVVVWDKDKGKPGKVLSQRQVVIQYPDLMNGFIEYDVRKEATYQVGESVQQTAKTPIAVSDTFYVGYLQLSDDVPLKIGLDKNTPHYQLDASKKKTTFNTTFFSFGSEWVPDTDTNSAVKGSLMIRPVMGGTVEVINVINKPLATEDEVDSQLIVSPNPSSGLIQWNNPTLKYVEVLDLTGRTVWKEDTNSQEINLQTLNTGIYMLRLSSEQHTFVRKIAITH